MSALSHPLRASILSLGFSNSDGPFTQAELLKCFSSRDNPKLSHFFDHPHIDTRYLILPPQSPNGNAVEESTGALLKKHKSAALEMGQKAVNKTLVPLGISPDQIDFVCCVSSTGFLVPGLSALLAQRLGFRSDCQRVDIVGMGCHGGLNGLSTVSNWCELNRRKKALLICSEVCSAIYSEYSRLTSFRLG
jgi:polyketide synthase Type III